MEPSAKAKSATSNVLAVWLDATDEELCQERPQLEAALKARLPALVAEFKQTMLDVGFIYPEHTTVAA